MISFFYSNQPGNHLAMRIFVPQFWHFGTSSTSRRRNRPESDQCFRRMWKRWTTVRAFQVALYASDLRNMYKNVNQPIVMILFDLFFDHICGKLQCLCILVEHFIESVPGKKGTAALCSFILWPWTPAIISNSSSFWDGSMLALLLFLDGVSGLKMTSHVNMFHK